MSKAEKKAFDVQVMAKMRDFGAFNQFNAEFLTDVSHAIQESNFNTLKPYKKPRATIDHQIASQIVLNYLTKHNMVQTIECIKSETEGAIVKTDMSDEIAKNIGLETNDYLHEIVQKWNQESDTILEINNSNLSQTIMNRLQSIQPQNEPQTQAGPKKHKGKRKAKQTDDK